MFKFNFQQAKDSNEVTIFDFTPKNEAALSFFQKKYNFDKIYYFQKPLETPLNGLIFSNILYGENISILYNQTEDENFLVEKGIPQDQFDSVKEFAIDQNKDEIIFPNAYINKFKKNSLYISPSDLSIQIYAKEKLVGHVSVIKLDYPLFQNKNLYLLMRFIVHQDFRKSPVKEILLKEISKFLPEQSALYLQVFPKNIRAINFFKSRLNVSLAYYKKLIEMKNE